MASRTYDEDVIVLAKTKLKESDLILTLMAADGRQVRAVAKGARKPTSSFASRLELCSLSHVLLVQGRSLEIVKESRFVDPHVKLRQDYSRTLCAMAVGEFLSKATQPDLPVPRLFAMTDAYLSALEGAEGSVMPLLTSAFFLKTHALLGIRPQLTTCIECGDDPYGYEGSTIRVAFDAGGVLCPNCSLGYETFLFEKELCQWLERLTMGTFAWIAEQRCDYRTATALLQFCQQWMQMHLGIRLKSFAELVKDERSWIDGEDD